MNNRIIAGLAVASLAGVSCTTAAPEEEKVNILWLFGEDISPWMPAYGDNTVETPNIDYLIDNGVLFTNCYASCSVSSPSRSAIITGAMQTSIGMHNHRTGRTPDVEYKLPEGVEVLPQIMRREGFFTFNAGKDDFNWQYNWSDYWAGECTQKRFFGKEGDPTISWLNREGDEPFFGVIELFGGKNHKLDVEPIDPSTVVVPPYYPNMPFMQEYMSSHYNQIKQTDYEIGNIIERMKADGVWENTIIIFMSDNGYQTLRDKQFLYDGGIHMPFVVAAPGNLKLLEKFGIERGVREDMISLIDVAATTLAIAGVEIPKYMESQDIFAEDFHRDFIVAARDRCDFTIDRIRAIRTKEFKYIRNFMTDRALMQPQYRDKTSHYKEFMSEWKAGAKFADEWLSDERPAEELYDVVNDPHEIHNLAADPKYAGELEAMRQRLDGWIEQTGDKGQYPESVEKLKVLLDRWGERCVNSEYDAAR
ncbi:MAG: sulfatase [Rikenellaceae bacterium]